MSTASTSEKQVKKICRFKNIIRRDMRNISDDVVGKHTYWSDDEKKQIKKHFQEVFYLVLKLLAFIK